jgi:DNA-3-methyladenine glycosylase
VRILSDNILPRAFYNRRPDLVAPDMLGKLLIRRLGRRRLVGRISEVEAYLGLEDPASHGFAGKTERNAVLFGPPGVAYVYQIYGLYHCLNVSCLPEGVAGGVLFRALLPLEGIDKMAELRGIAITDQANHLTEGPGRLCSAMGITREQLNNTDMTKPSSILQIHDDGFVPRGFLATKRIGIKKAQDLPLRFILHKGV